MIVIRASMRIKSGQSGPARAAFAETMAGSRQEPGCVEYSFTQDLADPDLIHVVELWESEAALGAHFQAPAFTTFMARAGELIDPVGMSALSGDLEPYALPM